MSALSTHHKRTKIETKTVKNKEARTSHLTKQRSIPSDKGNGSTQSIKHKHDSSKTEAGLDTVMPEAEGKPGAKQSRNSH